MISVTLFLLFGILPTFVYSAQNYKLCIAGSYCDGDVDAIRGDFVDADSCFAACSSAGKNYKYFDVTSNQECWCGLTCDSFVPVGGGEGWNTTAYSFGDGNCSPSAAHSEVPTVSFPFAPTQSTSAATRSTPTTSAPSQTPMDHSLCLPGYYCKEDVKAIRGLFTSPDSCYAACQARDPNLQFFDVTGNQQCWCGYSCSEVIPYNTTLYRMNKGVCLYDNWNYNMNQIDQQFRIVMDTNQKLAVSVADMQNNLASIKNTPETDPNLKEIIDVAYSEALTISSQFPTLQQSLENLGDLLSAQSNLFNIMPLGMPREGEILLIENINVQYMNLAIEANSMMSNCAALLSQFDLLKKIAILNR